MFVEMPLDNRAVLKFTAGAVTPVSPAVWNVTTAEAT
jgi:hypothetical protein